MAIEIQRPATGALWTSPERLFVTASGEVCTAKDPRRVSLLIAEGGQMLLADAERWGLPARYAEPEAVAIEAVEPEPSPIVDVPPVPNEPLPESKPAKAKPVRKAKK